MSMAKQAGTRRLAAAVRSRNTCKACAFGTGGQRGGLHNEYSSRIEICNKNIQAQSSDLRPPIPAAIFADNTIDELRTLTGRQLEALGRLETPLYKPAGATSYQPIGYDAALDRIAAHMARVDPQRSFFYGSGRSSNEAAFLLQLLARMIGCNHVNNCSYYCHQASGVGLTDSIGTGTATIQYSDLHKADLIFVLGANPASNHPRFVKVLLECRQRGGTVIVVNPAREAGLVRFASPSNFRSMITGGGEVATHYVQPHVGGDVAFLQGVAKYVLEQRLQDDDYIARHCTDFDSWRESIAALEWQQLQAASGVSAEEIARIGQVYGAAQNVVFAWGMGLTHHLNGTDNIQAVANLALLRGMIGGVGRGLLPLRGHSNVQGVGSMGLTPKLKDAVITAMERELGIKLPVTAGMDTLTCVQAAECGTIDFALLLGGNLYAANPDSAFSTRALDNIPFKVMINSSLNETHLNGVAGENLVLPIRVRDEEQQATTQESMFNFVRLSDGGFERIAALRSEVELVCGLATRVINPGTFDFNQLRGHDSIRQMIARLVPGFEQLAAIDTDRQEFHIGGRHLTAPRFPTPDSKARFRKVRMPRLAHEAVHDGFTLTSVRSEGQFNTIIYNEEDVYRRVTHRQVLFMHGDDIARLGMQAGDRVDVSNATGTMQNLELADYPIKPGNVMAYFPEANVLVPQSTDERSRTPAFKAVGVSVRPAA